MSDKSILDTVADEANKLFEHAAQQVKNGNTTGAREALSIAELMSYHVREIEDHDYHMGRDNEAKDNTFTITAAPDAERPRF